MSKEKRAVLSQLGKEVKREKDKRRLVWKRARWNVTYEAQYKELAGQQPPTDPEPDSHWKIKLRAVHAYMDNLRGRAEAAKRNLELNKTPMDPHFKGLLFCPNYRQIARAAHRKRTKNGGRSEAVKLHRCKYRECLFCSVFELSRAWRTWGSAGFERKLMSTIGLEFETVADLAKGRNNMGQWLRRNLGREAEGYSVYVKLGETRHALYLFITHDQPLVGLNSKYEPYVNNLFLDEKLDPAKLATRFGIAQAIRGIGVKGDRRFDPILGIKSIPKSKALPSPSLSPETIEGQPE